MSIKLYNSVPSHVQFNDLHVMITINNSGRSVIVENVSKKCSFNISVASPITRITIGCRNIFAIHTDSDHMSYCFIRSVKYELKHFPEYMPQIYMGHRGASKLTFYCPKTKTKIYHYGCVIETSSDPCIPEPYEIPVIDMNTTYINTFLRRLFDVVQTKGLYDVIIKTT